MINEWISQILNALRKIYNAIENLNFTVCEMELLILYLIQGNKYINFAEYGLFFDVNEYVGYKNYYFIHKDDICQIKFMKLVECLDNITLTGQQYVNFIFLMVQEYNKNNKNNFKIDIKFDNEKIIEFQNIKFHLRNNIR